MNKIIGIVGDLHQSKTQLAIASSIEHANNQLGLSTKYYWIETPVLDNPDYFGLLKNLDGIWSASGSPFKSMAGALNAIHFAREQKVPHIGTCGGYQHAIIEYARNVSGLKNAGHAEYADADVEFVVNKMTCSLAGTRGKVSLKPGSLANTVYATTEIEVDYYCSYGLNPDYEKAVLQGDLEASGFDANGAVRMMELKNHPFFVITAFVPQMNSSYDNPDKLILEFVKKVNFI